MAYSDQERGAISRTINVLVTTAPHDEPKSPASRAFAGFRSILELAAKLLPGLALLTAVFVFRTEISDYLKHTSKVEIFGVKLEKEEFEKRVEAARRTGPASGEQPHPQWADAAYRKLNLAAPLLNGMRLLWVDDHPQNNFYLCNILVDFGVQVYIAIDNAEAIDQLKRGHFDVVISDYGRDPPLRETGGDLAKEIVRLKLDVPILFYTAHPQAVQADEPHAYATNDPAQLLGDIAETAFAHRN